MKVKSIIVVLAMVVALAGCATDQIKFPDTPKGRGLFFINLWESQQASYMARFPLSGVESDKLLDKLKGQRRVLVEGHFAIGTYGEYVQSGATIPTAILDRINQWLTTLEDDYVYSVAVNPKDMTDAEIKALLVKAGIISRSDLVSAEAIESNSIDPILIGSLIELIRTSIAAYLALLQQSQMTPEQVDGAWLAKWPVFKNFNVNTLPLPVVIQ